MKKEIIIAGYGFVGKAVGRALEDKNIIQIIDPKINDSIVSDYKYADGLIICVGTPSTETGDCDVSQIYQVIDTVPIHIPILIKCTVRPDYLVKIMTDYPNHSICYSPEFLRAATANKDFLNQTYMVIGGDDPEDFWQSLFKTSLPNCNLFFNSSIVEASVIKYATNCFLSTKVSFFNQLYDVCEANGADYGLVRQILTHDSRIGNSHTLVPGPDMSRGFGGACFPKDTNAFIKYADSLNTPVTVVESAVQYNKTIRNNA
jgi:UDPglucose 6-dehydrogenase